MTPKTLNISVRCTISGAFFINSIYWTVILVIIAFSDKLSLAMNISTSSIDSYQVSLKLILENASTGKNSA